MQRNKGGPAKGGLTDLKRLRQQAQTAEQPPRPPPAPRAARKRAPFQMPGGQPGLPPDSRPAGASRAAAGSRAPATPATHSIAQVDLSLLSEEDRKLFRSAVKYVDRIKDPGRLLLAPIAPAPEAILKERRMRAAGIEAARPPKKRPGPADREGAPTPPADTPPARKRAARRHPTPLSDDYAPAGNDHDDSRYLKAGHGTDVLRDLKRGKWPIGATLDLHGSTLDDARERFERFLGSCLTHEVKCVHIVHGKGHGSPDGNPVLKTTVRRWLTQMPEVIAYVECAEPEGGAGAVQVLLK